MNTDVKQGAAMLDKAGRRKRRGNHRPMEGKTFRIMAFADPLDEWCSHFIEVDGKPLRTSLMGLVMGSEQYLREMAYRAGGTEVVE